MTDMPLQEAKEPIVPSRGVVGSLGNQNEISYFVSVCGESKAIPRPQRQAGLE
jgi:hypothetical protein